MGCKVIDWVRQSYPSLDEGASIAEAARVMAERDLGSILVSREGRVVGLFTERDLIKRVVAAGRDPDTATLKDVSTYNLVSIRHDSSCLSALQRMHAHRCRRLLAYRGDQLLGLVKLTDVANALATRGGRSDLLINAIGVVTVALALGVIAMLLFQLPDIFRIAGGYTH